MKLLKNKLFIGTLCIILGLLFGFVAIPMTISGGESAEITAVRTIGDVKAGTQLTADMVETVTVPENVVEGGIRDVSSVIGQ